MNASPLAKPAIEPSDDFDDLRAALPNMDLFHDLRIACAENWTLLAELMAVLGQADAKLCSLSAQSFDGGGLTIKCRLSALSSDDVGALAQDLTLLSGVSSATVEHVFLRAKRSPGRP